MHGFYRDGTTLKQGDREIATFHVNQLIPTLAIEYMDTLIRVLNEATSPKTCKTCKHWRMEKWQDYHTCKRLHESQLDGGYADGLGYDHAGASCDDGGEYAEFICGPDFGCIHHEEAP